MSRSWRQSLAPEAKYPRSAKRPLVHRVAHRMIPRDAIDTNALQCCSTRFLETKQVKELLDSYSCVLYSRGFSKEYLAVGEMLVSSTLEVYKNAMTNLLPTPAKSHYLFNLRDFARVIQGTLLSTPDITEDADNLKRLWCHEVCHLLT